MASPDAPRPGHRPRPAQEPAVAVCIPAQPHPLPRLPVFKSDFKLLRAGVHVTTSFLSIPHLDPGQGCLRYVLIPLIGPVTEKLVG